jgi:hypothetical protein
MLPYRERLIHVRWSGEACWIPLGDLDFGLGYENATSYPAPGQLLLYPGGVSETEILLAYGSVRFASKVGQPFPDNRHGNRAVAGARPPHAVAGSATDRVRGALNQMAPPYPRDLIGYGATPPHAQLPECAVVLRAGQGRDHAQTHS